MIGFERDPPGQYFGFFQIEQEKKIKAAIKKEQEKSRRE